MSAHTRVAIRRLEAQELPTPAVWQAATAQQDLQQVIADIISSVADDDHERLASPVSPPPIRTGSGRRRIPVLVGAAVIAAVTVLSVLIVPSLISGGTASAVTPTPLSYTASTAIGDSATLLTKLAAAAAMQPPEPGSGPDTYTKIQSWDFTTNQDVNGNVISSAVVPTVRETWAAPDGSGREIRSNPERTGTTSQDNPAGTPALYQNLPADPAALKQVLGQAHPDRDTSEWFVAVTDVWGVGRPVPAATQSGLLKLLAAEPDITVLGTTVDRAGRTGVAISTDTNAGFLLRRILVLDRSTGRLLSAEEVALTNSSQFPVTAPATIGYTMWLAAAKVPTTGSRPTLK
ncbi:hypothetical protein ABIB25_005925 [Nakamurella sp. UYEF19]|uniref:CU044_5270 family protein n=1 Tax=Nakamurella sp. UYEF19 TaxID=1756392 RepID=UPI003395CD03